MPKKKGVGAKPAIRFEATLLATAGRTILRLPAAASKKLPSRGQVAVEGTFGGKPFQTVIEPDGELGHWIKVDAKLAKAAGAGPGVEVEVEVAPADEWPEPSVPADLQQALSKAEPEINELWQTITPMARWEWVRWVNETKNPDTRKKRVDVSISKMKSGKRRPCCFNLASCTDPELAKSGKLAIDPGGGAKRKRRS
ncbi:MAG: DUF1905 domain-containing protein [Sandaracinaceae bacterium]